MDNRELAESWSYNLISEIDCVSPNAQNLDDDLTLGLMFRDGYSKGKYIQILFVTPLGSQELYIYS